MAGRIAGRVAVVTGAAGGLGREFSVALAREGALVAGVDVAPLDGTAEAVAGAGGRFHGVTADITAEEQCARMAADVRAALGPVTVVVNNAGVYPSRPFADTTFAEWRRIMALNVDGTFLVTRALLPQMLDEGWGRIVNIASAVVWLGPPGMVAYTASKGALIGFTRSLAAELGPTGVTVNAITPGLTRTETALSSAVAADFGRVVASQAVPRAETPADLTSTLLYICDAGSAFLTGQAINVDGGFAKH